MRMNVGCFVVIFIIIAIIGAASSITDAYFKMRAYNRVSEKPITLLDAMFSDIKIIPVQH